MICNGILAKVYNNFLIISNSKRFQARIQFEIRLLRDLKYDKVEHTFKQKTLTCYKININKNMLIITLLLIDFIIFSLQLIFSSQTLSLLIFIVFCSFLYTMQSFLVSFRLDFSELYVRSHGFKVWVVWYPLPCNNELQ